MSTKITETFYQPQTVQADLILPPKDSKTEVIGKTVINSTKEDIKPSQGVWERCKSKFSLGFSKKPIALETAIAALIEKVDISNPVGTKKQVELFVKKNWDRFEMPKCCSNSSNQDFLVQKITRVLLDHNQDLEIKKQIIQNVLPNFISYLKAATKQIESDLKTDKELIQTLALNPKHQILNMVILGDETHNQGKNPLKIELSLEKGKVDRKIVFKPRSMITESSICGPTSSAFAAVDLPTYPVYNKNTYGYSAWLENNLKENTFSTIKDLEAYISYFPLMNTVVSFYGISDLHQENVLTSKGKPYLIDTEVIAPVIGKAYESGLLTGITAGYLCEYNTPNRICISESILDSQNFQLLQGEFSCMEMAAVLSDLGIMNKVILPALQGKSKRVLEDKEINALTSIKKELDTHSHRIILVKTSDLARYLKEDPLEAFSDFQRNLDDGLKTWGFSIDYVSDDIKALYEQDFMNNDVPVFYFNPSKGEVYYHDLVIGKKS